MTVLRALARHGIAQAASVRDAGPPDMEDMATNEAAQVARVRRLAADVGARWPWIVAQVTTDAASADGLHGYTDNELKGYVLALYQRAQREHGIVPEGWNTRALCEGCGIVWLWKGCDQGRTIACPWCAIRAAGGRFPRPSVTCGACIHFLDSRTSPGAGIGECKATRTPRDSEPLKRAGIVRQCDEHMPRCDAIHTA